MCGITGIISYRQKISEKMLYMMTETLFHRGPDDRGVYISDDKKAGLGNTRLSIIDLSEKAHQPMCNEDKSLWITYNGEIYNYKELRETLIKKGHKFKSNSDTEVILHLYEDEKENCVLKLRGIFAFAIWNEKEKKLFLARDKMGVKPLYYYLDGNFLIFSSEIKAIAGLKFIKKSIDMKGIEGFLLFGSVPSPYTIFKDIKILEPASYLVLSQGKVKIERYWNMKVPDNKSKDYKEIGKKLYEILNESVKINLIADVPVGIFLSGGIDSGTVLYFARKNNQNKLKTFSIVFKEKEFDERLYSRLLSEKFKTEHHEYEITSFKMKEEIENFLKSMDLPTIDGFNTYFVSKIAKENGIKTCVSGLGGDELFGGYSSFSNIPRLMKFKRFRFILKMLSRFLKEDKKYKLKHLLSEYNLETSFFSIRALYTPEWLSKILNYKDLHFDPLLYLKEIILKENFEDAEFVDKISLLEARTYMHNQLLRDTDVFSMCNSLEVRVPLIDEKLVEFAFKIPCFYKKDKIVLKDVMRNHLPQKIIKRAKRGFFFPIESWLKKELNDFIREGLEVNSFFNKNEVLKIYKKFKEGKIHWSRIWAISILNHYLKENRLC